MKVLLKNKVLHYVVVLLVLGFALYTYFVATPKGEALETKVIGTLTVDLVPNPSSAGTEQFTFSYSGIGVADISGWRISNDDTFTYTFGDTKISSADSMTVCADSIRDPKCEGNEWVGGAVWDDASGTFTVFNEKGVEVASKGYTGLDVGVATSIEFGVEGYFLTNKDSIQICHAIGTDKYSSPKGGVGNIANGQGGHSAHAGDIIPPFFYQDKTNVRYYEGLNWPDESETYDNNCTK